MTTPIRRQYLAIKKQYPEAIVFFRLGDFYETFDEDAQLIAKELDIVLTSRKISKNQRVPMAGVPHHSAENYIARLIRSGYKVAVCEQLGSTPVDGLVPREVQRVITPGTVVEGTLLNDNENNYLAAIVRGDNRAGLAYIDITTGQFAVTQLHGSDIERLITNELARLKPAEVIGPDEASLTAGRALKIPHSCYEPWRFDQDHARRELQQHFDVGTLDGFGLHGKPLAVQAAGGIIQYVAETQQAALNHITTLSVYSTEHFMDLDANTRRNLELTETIRTHAAQGSLLGVLDRTITPMGGRLLRTWLHQPLLDAAALNRRLDAVERFTTHTLARGDLRAQLKAVADLERLTNRVSQGLALPRDLLAIQRSLEVVPDIQAAISELLAVSSEPLAVSNEQLTTSNEQLAISNEQLTTSNEQLAISNEQVTISNEQLTISNEQVTNPPFHPSNLPSFHPSTPPTFQPSILPPLHPSTPPSFQPSTLPTFHPSTLPPLDPCPEIIALIRQAIAAEPPATLGKVGFIRAGFSAELDGIISSSREAKIWVANLERVERERTGIKSLKVGYNKVFGYYIEVTRAHSDVVPADYIRKQTLVNGERYITPELKEYESLILNADERQLEVEVRIFREVCARIAAAAHRLLATARGLAYLDVVSALAEVALHHNYIRPELSEDDTLEIINGRHPVVETMPLTDPDGLPTAFVPNDVRLSREELIHIITGPNMSGKSTFLRQVALIVLLAQIGSFVPADRARIGLVDRIFTRIGAQDEIHAGQSTFMVEMVETAAILSQSSNRSLLILDEVGRGTSTYDGLAIARAVVEYIHNNPRIRAKTLFATHYHELTELAKYLPHLRNYNVAVSEEGGRVVFLHKIVPGGADRSYGIHVAQIAGIPKAVIDRANEILEELEGNADFTQRRDKTRQAFSGVQMTFFGPETDPLVEELKTLNVDAMTPLEALNKLYGLKQQAERKQQ